MKQANGFAGWRMVAIAFLAQNTALMMATSAFGTVMVTMQEELGTTRALASAPLAVLLLSLGLLSPLIGNMLNRAPLRLVMAAGAILNLIGYLLVAYATTITQVLLIYGLLIGPGATLLGPLVASTLVTRWFDRDRGKALGIVNMPVFMLIAPPAAAFLVLTGGRQLLFLGLAGMFLLLLPLVLMVVDRPEQIGQHIRGKADDARAAATALPAPSNRALLANPKFWLLSIGGGVISGTGSAFVVHVVPIAVFKGIDLATASMLTSVFGSGSMIGAIAFGWLIDKIGPMPALVFNATMLAILWIAVAPTTDLSILLVLAGLIGICMGATIALHSAALTEMFGAASFSRAMGFSSLLKTPLLFAVAPVTGYLFDRSGGYHSPILVIGGMLAVAATLFLVLMLHQKYRVGPAVPTA